MTSCTCTYTQHVHIHNMYSSCIKGYLPFSEDDPSCFSDKELLCKVEFFKVGLIFFLFDIVVAQPGAKW